jgi:phage shock protein A
MATWDGELQEIEAVIGALRDTVNDVRRRLQMLESKIVTLEQQQGLMLKETAKRRQI